MIDKLVEILHSGDHSLVIENGSITTYDGRGVSDLYRLYTKEPDVLNGAILADKVVGKGAAAIMILGKVRMVHADVISRPALSLLESNGVTVIYSMLADNIINRQGNGICPVESICLDCNTAEDCFQEITGFIKSNSKTNILK